MRNPNATIIPVSAKTGYGIDALAEWLRGKLRC
jgi:hydrogenase nickel incorporation protein HypB